MKAVFVTTDRDYANLGYMLSQCLDRVGVDSKMYMEKSVAHAYPKHGIVFGKNIDMVKKEAKNADIIVFVQGKYIDLDIDLSKKKVAVFYGATNYRKRHDKLNKKFNPIVDVTLLQTGDLLDLGGKNQKWIAGCVDTKAIIPKFRNERFDPMKFGHYPSRPKKKGTGEIIEAMKNVTIKHHLEIDYTPLDWLDHLKRINNCDIYIEQFQRVQEGKYPLCSYGLSALEAAAMGRIVLVNFCYLDTYEEQYGKCPLVVANTKKELTEKAEWLISLSFNEYINLQLRTRRWVEDYHSFESIGKRMLAIFEEIKK